MSVMKMIIAVAVLASGFCASVFGQEPIYRCGDEYTNTVPKGKDSDCVLLKGGTVELVPAPIAPVATWSLTTPPPNWIAMGGDADGLKLFIDKSTTKTQGPYTKVWTLWSYELPKTLS